MEWHSVKEQPEWGNGCRGKVIRTDGYSTYLNAELESGVKAIDTWFALESYPTDTASCIALLDKYNQLSFSLCVTRFGDLVAITRNLDKGTSKTFSLQKRINCFEWFNIALSMEKDYFSCFLNGKQLTNIPLKKEKNVTDKWLLRFGKDFFEKKVGMYDVNRSPLQTYNKE
jgi:beta-fructofuranosidase